jgi:ankyrin repeat protein
MSLQFASESDRVIYQRLWSAIDEDRTEIVNEILRQQSEALLKFASETDTMGALNQALEWAAKQGRLDMVKAFVAAGGDVNAARFHTGQVGSEEGMIQDLFGHGDQIEPVVRWFIRNGARISQVDKDGQRFSITLIAAAMSGCTWAIEDLISHGTPMNGVFAGATALDRAIQCGREETVAEMRRLGAMRASELSDARTSATRL